VVYCLLNMILKFASGVYNLDVVHPVVFVIIVNKLILSNTTIY
jgi:hypothetical protein